MTHSTVSLMRALDFAARKHRDQRRKGVHAEPYINHLAEVARLVAEAAGSQDSLAVLGALLHDTIEDTQTTMEELQIEFGSEAAALVAEVTDDKRLPKQERKQIQVQTASSKSRHARLIKIADKISNLGSIIDSPPETWDTKRKRDYFEWASSVVSGCRGVDSSLEATFDETYEKGMSLFGEA